MNENWVNVNFLFFHTSFLFIFSPCVVLFVYVAKFFSAHYLAYSLFFHYLCFSFSFCNIRNSVKNATTVKKTVQKKSRFRITFCLCVRRIHPQCFCGKSKYCFLFDFCSEFPEIIHTQEFPNWDFHDVRCREICPLFPQIMITLESDWFLGSYDLYFSQIGHLFSSRLGFSCTGLKICGVQCCLPFST